MLNDNYTYFPKPHHAYVNWTYTKYEPCYIGIIWQNCYPVQTWGVARFGDLMQC